MELSFERITRFGELFGKDLLGQYRILPCAEEDGCLVFATDRSWSPREVDDLMLRIGRRIRLHQVPASPSFDRMLFAVSNGVSLDDVAGEMEIDCDPRFRLKCPLNWFELEKTQDALARLCRVCDQTVYFARTQSERDAHRDRGHCVAFRELSEGAEGELSMGYVVDLSEDD